MAGRIPQHFIDDLLARVNIVDVIDGRLKLKRAGKNYSALCPFHKEKSPSFSVSPDKQFYYCFGCGAGGNALGFLMEYERLSFPEAVEELARLAGMDVPREHDRPADLAREQQIKTQFSVLEQANLFYQRMLRHSNQRQTAVDYLKRRGLSGQIAARFQIGFAPPGWDNLINEQKGDRPLFEKGSVPFLDLLERAGLVVHNEERQRHYDRFRDRIMFPIRDMRGRVIGFGGRVLGDEKPKYLNSPETDTFHKGRELYGLYEARQHTNPLQRLLIVEGYMDVVSLAQHGITWAVATLGTATTPQHLERIFKIVPEVIFCFDGDNAGRQAAHKALNVTLPVIRDGQQARFLFLPEGEDPDTLVRKEGETAFAQRVSEALPLSEFFFRALSEGSDLNSMDGRARFSTQALPLIQSMQPGLLQQMMMDRICEITGLSLEQLRSVIDLHRATEPAPSQPRSESTRPAGKAAQHTSARLPGPSAEPDYYPASGGDYDAPPPHYEDYASDYGHPADTDAFYGASTAAGNASGQGFSQRDPANKGLGGKGKTGSRLNLVSNAISILLHRPELAAQLPAAAMLEGINETNIDLLIALIDYLQATPGASLGTLLVDWQIDNSRAGWLMLLNEISHLDPILAGVDAASLLSDTVRRLLDRKAESHLDQLLKKQRQAPLTSDEKKQLQELLIRATPSDS